MQPELNGILIVDKPEGISSAQAVSRVKKIFGVRKAGHGGTLDPFATGLLICLVNQATRLSRFFLEGSKSYEAVMRLGVETDTLDRTGRIVLQRQRVDIDTRTILVAVEAFRGGIRQIPPAYSALKYRGVPLYQLAREGRSVERPAREVEIYDLEVTDIRLPDIHFRVRCSSGTYIRTLAADIGKRLGVGAHLTELKRTQIGAFTLSDATPLDGVAQSDDPARFIIPMESALPHLPQYVAEDRLVEQILHGNPVGFQEIPLEIVGSESDFFRVVDRNGRLLAIMCAKKGNEAYDYCCVFTRT